MGRWVGGGLLVGALLLGGAASARAETPPGEGGAAPGRVTVRKPDAIKVEKKTQVDFNESHVDGQLIRPDGSYIPGTKRAQFESLIQMRSHFYEELEKSSQDL